MFKTNGAKTLIWSIIILLCANFNLYAEGENLEWYQQVVSTTQNLNSIFFAGNNGVIVGDAGTLLITPDYGTSWYNLSIPGGPDLNGAAGNVYVENNKENLVGTLAGDNGALYQITQLAGGAVVLQQQNSNLTNNFNDVFCTPVENNNWYTFVVGNSSKILNSPDRGNNWYEQVTQYHFDDFYSSWFSDSQNGWIAGLNGILYNTTNGGGQWNYVEGDSMNPNYYSVYFQDVLTGWLCGSGGKIFTTNDGGANWTRQSSGTNNNLNDIIFTNPTTGWAVGDNGALQFTKDTGATWYFLFTNTSYNLNSITKDAQGNMWVVGNNGTLLTNKKPANVQPNRTQLNFAAVGDSDKIKPQKVFVNPENDQQYSWTVTSLSNWISVIPTQGTGAGSFSVYVDPANLTPSSYSGTILVQGSDPNRFPSIINVNFNKYQPGTTMYPFGSFDTPLDGSTVQGSVPFTGWVLDDVGVQSVKLYRSGPNGNIYIGDAVFVEGARPDLEQTYPYAPNNQKAGWGYMLLTNFLPNGGNGSYTFYAEATDMEGNKTTLGNKTITIDNAHAVKPFGAIDTPTPGGTASGSNFINWGWALTPQPNTIPKDGSTIGVYVDGQLVGHPIYNLYGVDLHALDPSNNNADGAVGYYTLDTKKYENGIHTLQWTVTDNAGNADGIGSRYFCIQNSSDPTPSTNTSKMKYGATSGGLNKQYRISDISADVSPVTQVFQVMNIGEGILDWQVTSDKEWLTLEPTSGTGEGWVYATISPAGLAAGKHKAEITISEINNGNPPEYIDVELTVYNETAAPVGEFNYPDSGRTVSGSINLYGWALDDIGVESVKIYRLNGTDKVYIGDAAFAQGARKDVATFYAQYPNCDRAGWSMSFTTGALENGEYTFIAEATDFEGNTTEITSKPFIIDNSNAVLPFGSIDNPSEGGIASGEGFVVSGWALTPQPNAIPADGSTIRVIIDGDTVGNVSYNQPREDISTRFPGYQNSAAPGGKLILDTTQLPNGVHTISWIVSDNAGNTNERLGVRNFMVLNNSTTTEIKRPEILPNKTDLLPGYPNPFNATTTISYQLAKDSHVSIYIYDILGRRVAALLDNEYKSAGSYRLNWNGISQNGSAVASGVYLLVFKSEHLNKTQKLLLLK